MEVPFKYDCVPFKYKYICICEVQLKYEGLPILYVRTMSYFLDRETTLWRENKLEIGYF